MRQWFVFVLISLAVALCGCGGYGGSSKSSGVPTTLTVVPSIISLESGQVQQLSVIILDANGVPVLTVTPTYSSSSSAISVSTGGLVCAGVWDSLTTPIVCTPAATGTTATITVTAGTLTKSVPVTVHPHVSRVTVSTTAPPGPFFCNSQAASLAAVLDGTGHVSSVSVLRGGSGFISAPTITFTGGGGTGAAATAVVTSGSISSVTVSSGGTGYTSVPAVSISGGGGLGTQVYFAHAFDVNGTDITSQVGAFTFTSSNPVAATIVSSTTDVTSGIATSNQPGSAFIIASLNNVFSTPATFTSCPPLTISLAPSTPLTLAVAATQQLTATTTDIAGKPIVGLPLTYSSAQPAVMSVSVTGLATGVGAGNTAIVASCTPLACNGGTGANVPVYSNLVLGSVAGSSSTTAYATGKTATTIVPIDTTKNTVGTAITIPLVSNVQPTVNSFVFSRAGTAAFLGTDKNLFILDPASGTLTQANATIPGKVLAVSSTGQQIVVADQTPGAPKTYVYDAVSGQANVLSISTITTAADFSADNLKAYLISGGSLFVYSPALAPPLLRTEVLSGNANDVTFLSQGSLAYLAGGNSGNVITSRATCDNSLISTLAVPVTPLRIASNVASTHVFAVDGTNIDDVTVSGIATAAGSNCPATVVDTVATFNFNQGAFTPANGLIVVTTDGSRVLVPTTTNKLLAYTVATHATSAITQTGATAVTSGGATLDSKTAYFGATGSNDVHRIDLTALSDAQQIAVALKDSTGAATSPDFVVVRPK